MANPYDFTSGYVGALEASAKADKQAMEREQYEDRKGSMIRQGLIKDTPKKKGLIEAFWQNLSDMGKRVSDGFPSFSSPNAPDLGGNRLETGGMASNMEAPSLPEIPVDQVGDAVAEVVKADGGMIRGMRGYADGTPGSVQADQQAGGLQQPQEPPQQSTLTDEEKVDALRGKSPYLALFKEDPKKAEQLYDQVSDFKKMSSVLKEMAAYDFIEGKGSDGLQKATSYIRQMQKEGLYEAALKASHGDLDGAKKAYMNYGDDRGGDFQLVPREVMGDSRGIKGGKEKFKVFDVVYGDGSKFTLDVQKLALEALSAKEYLERGDKDFEKDYKRADLGLKERELGIRAESNRQANEDRKDRRADADFNRGIQLGNATFDGIQRNEISTLDAQYQKEIEPFKDIAMTNPKLYEQKIAGVKAQYGAELGKRRNAFEKAREAYLMALQNGERIDPYTIYRRAYDRLGAQ